MKVLFAVNNEKVSTAIIKKYQMMYKEIISCKNVYFFNAIIKELQKDKSYDRIVIGEDLEPYANNNYEVIDNFLFDKLDSISDEASNSREGDIPIILIGADRREKGSAILVKLFGIGIYNVLLGQDRSIENVCKLIAQPRTKKEAKAYYRIEAEDVDYQLVDPDSVSETEIQNIIKHYRKLGKDEEKYVESFNDIAEQYTDTQLKLITKFLPLNVRAVLEERSPKYQQVMIGSVKGQVAAQRRQENNKYTTKSISNSRGNKIDLIDKELQKSRLTKPVVIPSTINMQDVRKAYTKPEVPQQPEIQEPKVEKIIEPQIEETLPRLEPEIKNETKNSIEEELDKRLATVDVANKIDDIEEQTAEPVKKGRGRPKKEKTPEELEEEKNKVKKGRGRPKKIVEEPQEEKQEEVDLFNMSDENEDEKEEATTLPGFEEEKEQPEENTGILPGLLDEEDEEIVANKEEQEKATILPGFDEDDEEVVEPPKIVENEEDDLQVNNNQVSQQIRPETNNFQRPQNNYINNVPAAVEQNSIYQDNDRLSTLLTGDKKIVAFVGTSKNGTSFLVNNLAALLSSKRINTAILDLTKNKNSYYIYTLNEDSLRDRAFRCIEGLRRGVAEGIQVDKNLTVYTNVAKDDDSEYDDYGNILETLVKNHSLILLDCDFNTNINYFAKAQELYLVQTYDILTIQPLTLFLNELKYRNILDQNKLRIVINKALSLRKLTDQLIIGGISCYNDPASTYINTLFDKDKVRYTTIPFETQTYAKYLERMVDCEISLNGYSKMFLEALNKLGDMVYPLIAGGQRKVQDKNYNDYNKKNQTFNSSMNETLNKMRNNF